MILLNEVNERGILIMIQHDVHLVIDEPQFEAHLHALADRLKPVNGWTEQDILNFSTNAFQSYFMPSILALMELHVEKLTHKEDTP